MATKSKGVFEVLDYFDVQTPAAETLHDLDQVLGGDDAGLLAFVKATLQRARSDAERARLCLQLLHHALRTMTEFVFTTSIVRHFSRSPKVCEPRCTLSKYSCTTHV